MGMHRISSIDDEGATGADLSHDYISTCHTAI